MRNQHFNIIESEVIPIYDDFDDNFYVNHILPVRHFSVKLAKELNKSVLLCDTAALLHDIGLVYGSYEHNINGSEESKKILSRLGYESKQMCLISQMIRNHSGSYSKGLSLEDEILRSSDGMAHISEMFYNFYSYLLKYDYKEAIRKTRENLQFEMEQKITIPLAKRLIFRHYKWAANLLNKKDILSN